MLIRLFFFKNSFIISIRQQTERNLFQNRDLYLEIPLLRRHCSAEVVRNERFKKTTKDIALP